MPRTVKPRRDRPSKQPSGTRVLSVPIPSSIYSELERLASQRSVASGAKVSPVDVVLAAIEKEITSVS